MAEIVNSLFAHVDGIRHPLIDARSVKKRGILVISSEKGLCGPLNTNLFKHINDIKGPASFVALGRKTAQFLSRTERELLAEFNLSDHVNFSEIRTPLDFMINQYLEGKIDTLEILFSHFVNTLTQEPRLEQLLPLVQIKENVKALRERLKQKDTLMAQDDRENLFEPNVESLIAELPTLFVKQEVFQMALEAKASEHSARMVAMKTATDNAKNLVDSLTLEYNKARQASITQEILEIAAATSSQSA
jgi:F-type H+-transporting ATPase subunit gamma